MIFYFTATGNSLYAAKKLDSELISIPQTMNSEKLEFTADKIGIVCPIYGHEMPAMVKEFLKKATFSTRYLYAVLTYGARHANAAELALNAFKAAGKTPQYIATLLMADNFLPVFDMNDEAQKDKNVDAQLAKIKADIDAEKHEIEKVTLQDKAMHKMYMAAVKNEPETVWASFDITDDCIGCGICMRVCPAGCIKLNNQRAVHMDDGCQACFACIHACPQMAIKMQKGEKNEKARYRNEHIALSEIVAANNRTDS